MTEQIAFTSVLVLCAVLVVALMDARLNRIERRMSALSRMETKLDLLLQHSGLTYDPHANLPPPLVEALQRGNKIEAIKRYRDATGVDLKAAKEFVEEVQRRDGVA
jgi:hypothetical protein